MCKGSDAKVQGSIPGSVPRYLVQTAKCDISEDVCDTIFLQCKRAICFLPRDIGFVFKSCSVSILSIFI